MSDRVSFGALRAHGIACVAGAALMMAAPTASAQYDSGFEAPTYTGSPEGTVLTGQDGWNLPAGIDQFVYTYTDNALGFPANPTGGDQFDGGTEGPDLRRGQHDIDFSVADEWEIGYDVAVKYLGDLPAVANLCSFSLQPSTASRAFISLNNFEDVNNPVTWKAEYNVANADGTEIDNQSPGAAWTGLLVDHWYRLTTTVNFSTNAVSHVTITDLDSGNATGADVDWFLFGGPNSALPIPTAVRFFIGGNAGNTAGFDNLSVQPAGAPPCYPDCNGDGSLDLFDFLCFTNDFNKGGDYSDCVSDGSHDLFDFLCFVNSFNKGC